MSTLATSSVLFPFVFSRFFDRKLSTLYPATLGTAGAQFPFVFSKMP